MKLVFTFFGKTAIKALVLVLILATATNSHARVFWNEFKASVKNNTVVLNWNVTEYNNKHFQIQHSRDGLKWDNVDSVASRRSFESVEVYSYTLTNKASGRHYYRLMDVDTDHKFKGYSEVIIVNIAGEPTGAMVWPNPATNQIKFFNSNSGNNNYTNAKIFDLTGKLVIEKKLQAHTDAVMINELPAGIYVVRAEDASGNTRSEKIIKQ